MKKLFICMVHYTQPLDKIEQVLSQHRSYLAEAYKNGLLLVSGPRNPREGGIIIGQFQTKDEVIAFSKKDPFCIHNVATYEIIEFEAVLHDKCLDNFLRNI